MDLYQILNIKPTASEVEIKKAYHNLVKIYHPDKNNSPDANEKFQKIQSAYEILINTNTRKEYQKMNNTEKYSFVDILEKIIGNKINMLELNKYNINLDKNDFEYIKNNLTNFFSAINVHELLSFFKNGIVPKKKFSSSNDCSDSDINIFDETNADYHYQLPISIQKVNKLDIRLDLQIKLGDIVGNNKRKIKIKRKINGILETSTFVFNLTNPYVVFIGGGDILNNESGNLIIKLNLPNNFLWDNKIIIIEQSMSLYELIYGLDISLDLGDNNITVHNWVPSRDGFLIEMKNDALYNLVVKLYLNYEDTDDKEQILKQHFHNINS